VRNRLDGARCKLVGASEHVDALDNETVSDLVTAMDAKGAADREA
jgi:hypothetical protein